MKILLCVYLTVSFISKSKASTMVNENYDFDRCDDNEEWSQTFDQTSQAGCSVKCTMNHCGYFKVEGKCFIGALGSQTPIQNGIWQTAKYIAKLNKPVNVDDNKLVNVALEKNTSASTVFGSHEPFYAVDGKTDEDHFESLGGNYNPWWMVDLGQVFKVKKIKILVATDNYYGTFQLDGVADLKIHVSKTYKNSSDYSDLPLFAEQVGVPSTDENEYEAEDFMCGRYVIIQRQNDEHYLEFVEVEVYGMTV